MYVHTLYVTAVFTVCYCSIIRTAGSYIRTYIYVMLQVVLNCSVLTALEHLCKSNHEPIWKEACWTVSNIAAGNKVQIQVNIV